MQAAEGPPGLGRLQRSASGSHWSALGAAAQQHQQQQQQQHDAAMPAIAEAEEAEPPPVCTRDRQ